MKKFPAIVTRLSAILLFCLLAVGQAWARLPAPTEEAKAKAAETKAKAGWSDKVAAYKLCLVQDKIAATYLTAAGKSATAAEGVSPCKDPGPYVSAEDASKLTPAAAPAPAPEPAKK